MWIKNLKKSSGRRQNTQKILVSGHPTDPIFLLPDSRFFFTPPGQNKKPSMIEQRAQGALAKQTNKQNKKAEKKT